MNETTRHNANLILPLIAVALIVGSVVAKYLITELVSTGSVLNRGQEYQRSASGEIINRDEASFKLYPKKGVFFVGDAKEITLKVNTGGVEVSVLQATLNYPYTYEPEIELVDTDKDPTNGVQVTAGKIKNMDFITNRVTVNEAEKLVTIELAAAISNPDQPFKTKKDIIFGKIKLKGVSRVEGKTLSFDQEKSKIVSDFLNENILTGVENGTYTIR